MEISGCSQVIKELARVTTCPTLWEIDNSNIVLFSGKLDAEHNSHHRVTYCDIKIPSRKLTQKLIIKKQPLLEMTK